MKISNVVMGVWLIALGLVGVGCAATGGSEGYEGDKSLEELEDEVEPATLVSEEECNELTGYLEECLGPDTLVPVCEVLEVDRADELLGMSCDELTQISDASDGSWSCLEWGTCYGDEELAQIAVPAPLPVPAFPIPYGSDLSGTRANSFECKQSCAEAISFYKSVCHEAHCAPGDADTTAGCGITRARFYENAQCALARQDVMGFCQTSQGFVPDANHLPPIQRAVQRANQCQKVFNESSVCGGGLRWPNRSQHHANLRVHCGNY